MTEIRPFQAVHYSREKVRDLNKVVCPPYDVISEEQQDAYYHQSPYNFIRVMLARQEASDTKTNNRYTRSRESYQQWCRDGILVQDEQPCIYFYKQEYKILGARHSRLGFIALMKIQDEGVSRVYPHEKTHAAAKEDRFQLWQMLNASLSSIFVCFSDRERKIEHIFHADIVQKDPFMDITDGEGVRHILWRLQQQSLIQEIVESMANQPVFIADGHHRFEVSRQIKQWKTQQNPRHSGKELYNYVMTYFTNMDSRDLQIFPMHRIVKTFPKDIAFLEEYFRMDRIKTREELQVLLAKAGQNEHAFGLCRADGMWLLRLKNQRLIDRVITQGSPEFKRLDASILKFFVFDKIGIPSEDIVYTKDADDITRMIENGRASAGFLMNPVRIHQLKEIALNGEKMPPKTTYFYPKLLSGLTISPFE